MADPALVTAIIGLCTVLLTSAALLVRQGKSLSDKVDAIDRRLARVEGHLGTGRVE